MLVRYFIVKDLWHATTCFTTAEIDFQSGDISIASHTSLASVVVLVFILLLVWQLSSRWGPFGIHLMATASLVVISY